jgi:hypothetical protein
VKTPKEKIDQPKVRKPKKPDSSPQDRDEHGRFLPGAGASKWGKYARACGGGQPGSDIRKRFKSHDLEAEGAILALLVDDHTKPALRLAAAREILDRAHGRPTQYVDSEFNKEKVEKLMKQYGQAIRFVLTNTYGIGPAEELMFQIGKKFAALRETGDEGED